MSWKKALFYGGAVLVLAACGDATSPTSPSAVTKVNGVSASMTKKTTGTVSSDSTSTPVNEPLSCAAAVIHVGLDGSLIMTCEPLIW